jgi:hypothetical protein
MVAEFRGAPPHDLGTAELAMARGVDKDIEVTLHLLDDWHRPTDQIVRVRMAPATARTLADRLWAVAETMDIQWLGALEDVANLPGPRMRSCTSSSSMRGMLAQLRAIVLRRRSSPAGLSNWGWRHSVHRS